MKDRIIRIRKDAKLNQEDFAKRINLTKNYISLIETGNRIPSDRTISDICREFNINEEWLRTGIEPMKIPRDGKLSSYMSEIVTGDDDFIRDLIEVYMELDKTSKDALKEIARRMADKQKGRE